RLEIATSSVGKRTRVVVTAAATPIVLQSSRRTRSSCARIVAPSTRLVPALAVLVRSERGVPARVAGSMGVRGGTPSAAGAEYHALTNRLTAPHVDEARTRCMKLG